VRTLKKELEQKKLRGMAQVVEYLPGKHKHKALSSNLNIA
jgi:hypothetical protein